MPTAPHPVPGVTRVPGPRRRAMLGWPVPGSRRQRRDDHDPCRSLTSVKAATAAGPEHSPQATPQGPTTLSMGRWLAAPPCSTSEHPPRLLPALGLPAAHLDLGLHLLGPSQFLGLGDGRGEKLGFKGWLGGVGDLLWLALSGNLLCCDLRKERPPRVRAGKALGPLLRATGPPPCAPTAPRRPQCDHPGSWPCLPAALCSCCCPPGGPGPGSSPPLLGGPLMAQAGLHLPSSAAPGATSAHHVSERT